MAKPNLIEDSRIPRASKSYLGDGLYAVMTPNGQLWIQSFNGVEVLDQICFDQTTLANLQRIAKEWNYV